MRVDIPQLNRCCFCMPLRRGLLTWVYVKLVLALIITLFVLEHVIKYIDDIADDPLFVPACIGLITFFLETIFDIIFIISAHTYFSESEILNTGERAWDSRLGAPDLAKNFVYLRIYYRYALTMLAIQVTSVVLFIVFQIYITFGHPHGLFVLHFMLELAFFLFGQIVLQIYFVILVRSELLKLENNTQFEFVNHVSEPECKAHIVA
ncbi:uncharacterized protein [Epargyreus clarus]|uniref:uncharacterized protein isoform X1 n=1 Tax=Epargyreus clarus TaxID=520877 RepID=UPI003C2AB60F